MPDRLSDADLLRTTAAWLRADPDGARLVGLGTDDIEAGTALLDVLAAELPHVDPAVAGAAVAWCRLALGWR